MIIDTIINNDLDRCHEALKKDKELQKAEMEFYNLLDQVDHVLQMKLEANYSRFTARAMRIAYLQGFKDFYEMCLILNKDVNRILSEKDNILL